MRRQKNGVPRYLLVFAPLWMGSRWGRLSAWRSTSSPGERPNRLLTSTIETAWPTRTARSTHTWVNLSTHAKTYSHSDSRFKWWLQSSGLVLLEALNSALLITCVTFFFLQDVPLGQCSFQQRSERSVFWLFIVLYNTQKKQKSKFKWITLQNIHTDLISIPMVV